jgi:hypothetical protein
MATFTVIGNREPERDVQAALEAVAVVLGVDSCWYYRGDFHFCLGEEWTVSLSPETAGRLRIETWRRLRLRDRRWARVDDRARLMELVRDARDSAYQPV